MSENVRVEEIEIETVTPEQAKKILKMAEADFKRVRLEAKRILSEDLTYIVLKLNFYAKILNKTKKNIVLDVPIAGVNVTNSIMNLYINPITYPKFEKRERVAIGIHEVLHLALGHIFRRGERDAYYWNLATDYVINRLIPNNTEIGLPEGCITKDSFPGVELPDDGSAEEVYDILWSNKEKIDQELDGGMDGNTGEGNGNGTGNQQKKKNSTGNDSDGNEQSEGNGNGQEESNGQEDGKKGKRNWHAKWDESQGNQKLNEAAVKKVIKQAHTSAKAAGNLPGNVAAHVEQYIESKINWRSKLSMFPAKHIQNGTKSTWKRESRRMGSLAKGKKKNKKLHIGLIVDTSASVTDENLAQFSGEIIGMWRTGAKITVIECDTTIHGMYEFDGKIKRLKYEGRGGTSFIPPFEKIEKERLQFDCVIYLTDGEGVAPDKFRLPTLWVLTPDGSKPIDTKGRKLTWSKASYLWMN